MNDARVLQARVLQSVMGLVLMVSLLTGCQGGASSATPTTALVVAVTATQAPTLTPTPVTLTPQRALLVIFDQFEESEYSEPRTNLEEQGVVVSVASSTLEAVQGSRGSTVQPDLLLHEVVTADYDAIVFIGGYNYENTNSDAVRIAQEAAAQGKVLAAICVAPVTLARAGVLKDKRATTSLPRIVIERQGGGIYTAGPVEQDGLLITANGPEAAHEFAQAVVAALAK